MAPNTISETETVLASTSADGDSKSVETKEILFEGWYYDVTSFVKNHPGGSIIEYYTANGEDATHAIQQFHKRSAKRVQNMMKAFKKRPATEKDCMF